MKELKNMYKIRLQSDFFLKLATNGQNDKAFLLTSKFWPQGLGLCALAPGLYSCIKLFKNMYKIRAERDFFFHLQKMIKVIKPFCWDQNFDPKALSAPAPGGTEKTLKNVYKIRVQSEYFKTCNK